jgi:hypothetical protein
MKLTYALVIVACKLSH